MSRYDFLVGISLKAYRKKHKFAQKEMANKLNISREHYSRLEEGKIYPSRKLLFKINNLTGNQIPLPSGCKSAKELEMCYLCAHLKEDDKAAFKMKIIRLIKSYKKIQPLILSFTFQLFFNSDFYSAIFFS